MLVITHSPRYWNSSEELETLPETTGGRKPLVKDH